MTAAAAALVPTVTIERAHRSTTTIRVFRGGGAQNAKPSALVVFCHGLGGTAKAFIDVAEHFASQLPHIEFILPSAPLQPLTKNNGESTTAWYDIIGVEGKESESYSGIDLSAARIRDLLRNEHETRGVPYSRMILAGFSQGAALSLYVAMRLEQPVAGVLLLSGYNPSGDNINRNVSTDAMDQTAVLHLHGDSDNVVPLAAANEAQKGLIELGLKHYEIEIFPGVAHAIVPEEIAEALKFFAGLLPMPLSSAVGSKKERSRPMTLVALLVFSALAIVGIRSVNKRNGGKPDMENVIMIDPEEIAFNKFSTLDSVMGGDVTCTVPTPLRPEDFPVSGWTNASQTLCMLMEHTTAVSVIGLDDHETRKIDMEDLIASVGGPPSFPSSDESGEYWSRLERVIDVQKIRLERGKELSRVVFPDFPLPQRWVEFTVNEVAEAVHDEYPGLHQMYLIQDLMSGRYGQVKVDNNIIPQRARVEFLRGMVLLSELNTWAIGRVGPFNFGAKYFVGRARPEEVVAAIQSGKLSFVPKSVKEKVDTLPFFPRPTDFTAYPEGSPDHPSWPAMHAAASALSFWVSIVLDITPQQHCQAKLVDFAVAWGRTIAGVHHEDDNIAGLDMGQEIIARLLPDHLAEIYGADRSKVLEKVEAMRFSWRDFNPKEPCPGTDWMQWTCQSRKRRCSFRGPAEMQ